MALCNSCGEENAEGVSLCKTCGASLTETPAANSYQPASYNQNSQGQSAQSYNEYEQAGGGVPSSKSRTTAGILGILFGSLGIGRFYLGYTWIGIGQIAATKIVAAIGLGGLGALWGFIDGIVILCGRPKVDGKGLQL